MSKKREINIKIPDTLTNTVGGVTHYYKRGSLLGKGGFARCYELIDQNTKITYAGKIVSKQLLASDSQRDKMATEIKIHRSVKHPHIVELHSFFEDRDNVYIILELCQWRSLMELHKRRRRVSEPEARYFVSQIVDAVTYLHDNKIIHRDLKLGNIFLDSELNVKIGDFGLATILEHDGERKKTLCGTPNYIAPEMLDKKGHSFEVDIWAIACILYTLLVGSPPFESTSLKETYERIKKIVYKLPQSVSKEASELIDIILQSDPQKRPTIHELPDFAFFKKHTPKHLPISCLSMSPKFTVLDFVKPRLVLDEIQRPAVKQNLRLGMEKGEPAAKDLKPLTAGVENLNTDADPDYLAELYEQITEVVQQRKGRVLTNDDAEDPKLNPVYFIAKWVDYSDRYGLGYQLSDNSIGVIFNDDTNIITDAAGKYIQYYENGGEEFYTLPDYPQPRLSKKVTLLTSFKDYMQAHLQKAGANIPVREGDELSRLPLMSSWFRTRSAIVFYLSNGTFQLNFFEDHTKLVICPLVGAATLISGSKEFRVFKLKALAECGCSEELFDRLKYARGMIERMIKHKKSGINRMLQSMNAKRAV